MHTEGVTIIFQDIDGCLNPANGERFSVNPEQELSTNQASMLHLINQAVEASPVEQFIINSGRPWTMVQPILAHLPTTKARYVLLEHACVLYDRKINDYIDCAQLANDCDLSELATRYSRVDQIRLLFEWYRTKGQAVIEAHYNTDFPALDKVGNLSFHIPAHIDADECLQRVESLARAQLATEQLEHIQFLRSDSYIDILPGIHKLDGIHLLTAYLDKNLDQVMAMGDYLNDLPIFETFHRVLCPANAHPSIKALTEAKGIYGHVSKKAYGLALLDCLQKMSN